MCFIHNACPVRQTRVKRGPNVTFPPKKVNLALPRNPLTKIFCHYFSFCLSPICVCIYCSVSRMVHLTNKPASGVSQPAPVPSGQGCTACEHNIKHAQQLAQQLFRHHQSKVQKYGLIKGRTGFYIQNQSSLGCNLGQSSMGICFKRVIMFKWKLGGAFMGVYHTVIGQTVKNTYCRCRLLYRSQHI